MKGKQGAEMRCILPLPKLTTMHTSSRSTRFSPQQYARVGGVLYLFIIAAGMFGELYVRGNLFIPGNADATAQQIQNAPGLWRIGIVVDLLMQLCDLPLMLIFYVLLKPVNKNLALLNLLCNLIQTAVLVANKLNLLNALYLLGGAGYLQTFTPEQLHTLAYLPIKLHDIGFGVGLIFFGVVCLIEGQLIAVSGFFPKLIGRLMQLAGVCYLTNSFALILVPELAGKLFPVILLPPFVAELSLGLWLLIKGVNLPVWEQKVAASQRI